MNNKNLLLFSCAFFFSESFLSSSLQQKILRMPLLPVFRPRAFAALALFGTANGASIGLTFYDDYLCKSGAIAAPMLPSPVCSAGDGPGGTKYSIQMVAVGDGSTIVSTMGFPTPDCSFPALASAGGIASSVAFYDLGMTPVNICRPCSSAFATLSGKKAYMINTLSDPNIFGIFLACVAAVTGIYVYYMHRTKKGPFAEGQDWTLYLVGLWTAAWGAFNARCIQRKVASATAKVDILTSDPIADTDRAELSEASLASAAKGISKTDQATVSAPVTA